MEQEDSTFKQEAEILRGVKGLVEQENATSKQGVDVLDKAAELLKLSTKQSAQQVAVLDKVAELLGESEMLRAREDFNKALDEADGYCSDCPLCSPDYLIEVPLDCAIRAEAKADKMLDAAELNRLAILGSSVWDVSKTEAFVKKALDRSGTSLDRFFSHLVLAHVYFCHLEKGAELGKVEAGRKEFRLAIGSLQTETTTDAIRTRSGECYAIWAAHEVCLGNSAMYSQVVANATSQWTTLPDEFLLRSKWFATIEAAKRGTKPQISCLFKPPVPLTPVTLMPPVPNIPVGPAAPTPTPATPTMPTPATPTMPTPTPTLAPTGR